MGGGTATGAKSGGGTSAEAAGARSRVGVGPEGGGGTRVVVAEGTTTNAKSGDGTMAEAKSVTRSEPGTVADGPVKVEIGSEVGIVAASGIGRASGGGEAGLAEGWSCARSCSESGFAAEIE